MKAWPWPRHCSTTPTTIAPSGWRSARCTSALRRWKDAEDAFDKADPLTTKKEDRTYLLFLRGELAERQKHYEPAEQFFRQALDLDPDNAMTLNYLGYMLADKGMRLPEALKLIRKAVDLEPMNGAYLDSLGWVYFKMGEYELAEENLRQAVERDQTDPTVHDHLGDLYEKTGRIRLAAAQWELSLSEYRQVRARRRGAGRRGQGAAQARKRPREAGQAGKRHRRGQARIISHSIQGRNPPDSALFRAPKGPATGASRRPRIACEAPNTNAAQSLSPDFSPALKA